MINIRQATDSLNVNALTKKTEALAKRVGAIEQEQSLWDNIIRTLDIIIWPLAVIVMLYIFKKQISSIIDRFESADISSTGLAFKLQQSTELIGVGSSDILPKDGGGINPKDGGGINPKDGGGINPKDGGGISPKSDSGINPKSTESSSLRASIAESPYQMLIELEDAIAYKLNNKASKNGLNIQGKSNYSMVNSLYSNNIIDSYTAKKLRAVIELNTMGLNTPETTHEQVTQMKRLFNNINF
ncbi:hypothetical protein [Winogradskyella alexanderae]|uniref:Uncharacterized protein n=1 Tax=Winogradskyella alexanderae TaxID=2877123 RepID=A0ABS7XQU1_9FLAO|nr:hypothetical protein [Winogradskyella alexanderae]MCA0132380.1 hypothetical protein [Winogradskyella alexanderae]